MLWVLIRSASAIKSYVVGTYDKYSQYTLLIRSLMNQYFCGEIIKTFCLPPILRVNTIPLVSYISKSPVYYKSAIYFKSTVD